MARSRACILIRRVVRISVWSWRVGGEGQWGRGSLDSERGKGGKGGLHILAFWGLGSGPPIEAFFGIEVFIWLER